MPVFNCPLCKQQVSQSVYERITGIWQERQRQLADLKVREQQLQVKAKAAEAKFLKEKRTLKAAHEASLRKELQAQKRSFENRFAEQSAKLEKQKEAIENRFEKRLHAEASRIAKEERARQESHIREMERELQLQAENRLDKERSKIQKERASFEKRERLQRDQSLKLLKQYQGLQAKSQSQLAGAEKKIKSLEEQLEKNKTAQVLGFQNEKEFLEELRQRFPNDRFEHTGKGGDILHVVMWKGDQVGLLVYELKKVAHFSAAHIEQTLKAKNQREADYGVLITNAKRSRSDPGFSVSRGVVIIHPAGALVLIGILRDNLLEIAKHRLGKEERNKTIKAVMDYVQSPSFSNSLESIILDTIDLYSDLKKEVVSHTRHWEFRFARYRQINVNASKIDSNVVKLLVVDQKQKRLPQSEEIVPILLPEKIK